MVIESAQRRVGLALPSFSGITANGALLLARPRALGLSRSAIDLALYRRQAFTDLLSLWARAIRASDRRARSSPGRWAITAA